MILYKVAELAQRFGIRPSDAEASIFFVDDDKDPKGKGFYGLDFVGWPTDPHASEQFGKIASLLGIEQGQVKGEHLSDLEDIVDKALSLAPRARARSNS